MTELNKIGNFDELVKYYEENKDKPWEDWLVLESVFPNQGKQGTVGTMKGKDKDLKFIFKVSQYINYLVHHEYIVMKSLSDIANFCPHFCRVIGNIICNINPKNRKMPFEHCKYPIEKEVLLLEQVKNSYKFFNYLSSSNIDQNVIYSTIKQTLLAILIAQRKKQFSHYDLHSNNILLKKCDKDLVFLYILDDENQYCIPTFGHYPVIIDCGFSYSSDLNNGPLFPSLNHTDIGFMSDRFDPIADPKLFLVSVSDEIQNYHSNVQSKKLINIVRNLFSPLPLDWLSGWDKDTQKSANDYVIKMLGIDVSQDETASIFEKEPYDCLNITQTLIVMPIGPQKIKNLGLSYKTFINEFKKIEREIGSVFYCLYILKGIVDLAREIRTEYTKPETRGNALKYFKSGILERVDSVSQFCMLKDLHYEKMLCSLYCFSKALEGVLYQVLEDRMNKKTKNYDKLPIKTIEEMYGILEVNIPHPYTFNDKTVVISIDARNNICDSFVLNEEQTNHINGFTTISQGSELFEIHKEVNCLKL